MTRVSSVSRIVFFAGMFLLIPLFFGMHRKSRRKEAEKKNEIQKDADADALSETLNVPKRETVSRGSTCNPHQNIVCAEGLECTNRLCTPEQKIAQEPAAQYCRENEGSIDIRQDDRGADWRYCVFENGSECEEQEEREKPVFHGECQQGDSFKEEREKPGTPPSPLNSRGTMLLKTRVFKIQRFQYSFHR